MKDKNQQPLVPAGGPRDFFLHLPEEHQEQALKLLRDALKGLGEVYMVEELIEQGLFGTSKNTNILRSRVGSVVALPYEGESFWWAGMKRSILKDRGFHGGLIPSEMEIPFVVYPL